LEIKDGIENFPFRMFVGFRAGFGQKWLNDGPFNIGENGVVGFSNGLLLADAKIYS
jgi:hypothetical protein